MSSFFLPNWSPPDDPARPLPAEDRPWPSDDNDGGGGDDAHCTYGQRFVLFGIGLHSSDYFATPDSLPLEHKYTNTPIHFYNQISIN